MGLDFIILRTLIIVTSNKFASDNKTGWICDLEWDKSSYLSGTSIVHDLLKSNETLACM